MKRTAVTSAAIATTTARLKQAALLFDDLVVYDLGSSLWEAESHARKGHVESEHLVAELEWLRDQGFIADPDVSLNEGVKQSVEVSISTFGRSETMDSLYENDTNLDPSVAEIVREAKGVPLWKLEHLWQRMYAAQLRSSRGIDAIVLADQSHSRKLSVDGDLVYSIVLHSLPVPDDSTPWELIFDFRADPEARGHLLKLRRWINSVVAEGKFHTGTEVQLELEYLVHEYQEYMKLHSKKLSVGTLECLVTAGAEAAENLVKLRWGKAAQALFSVSKAHLQLLEAERQAPGRELVYISEAARRFRT